MKKQHQTILESFKRSTNYRLEEVYNKFSLEKARAQFFILEDMKKNNGKNFKILSHNCMMFTCCYEFSKEGKNYLKYFSKTKTIVFEI